MGFLDIHQSSIQRSALQWAANPGPAPEPGFSLWDAAQSVPGAMAAGGLEALGTIRDLANATDLQTVAEKRGRAQRLGIPFDESRQFVMPSGQAQRKKADEFMPDPQTAHTATNVVAGLTKTVTKAAGAMAVAGPTGGAVLFGAGEANDTAQRLQEHGVDASTAWQVGGVVGLVSAAGVRLPVSGAALATSMGGKVAATAGLAAAGGPLSYVAQEGLSREILQAGGYGAEAAKHDPFDPVGLGVSLFPFLLGGGALAMAARKGAKVKPAGQISTEADVKAAVQLSPVEQAASDAFERSAGNLAELRAAIAAEKRPEARALLEKELQTQEAAASRSVNTAVAEHGAADPATVDAARVAVLDETVARGLPDVPGAQAEMLRAADLIGAGEAPHVADMQAMARMRQVDAELGDLEASRRAPGGAAPAEIDARVQALRQERADLEPATRAPSVSEPNAMPERRQVELEAAPQKAAEPLGSKAMQRLQDLVTRQEQPVRDFRTEVVQLRKERATLSKLLECINA